MSSIKALPFKQIKPIKFLGISNELPFSSLVAESKLVYFSGRHIVLENLKTYDQKIIWTNENPQIPQFIDHTVTNQRQNLIVIASKDDTGTHLIEILSINSQINNYEHLNKKEREQDKSHYLKNVPSQMKILKVCLFHEGSLFSVVASHPQIASESHLYVYRSSSGDLLYSTSIDSESPLVESTSICRLNYLCVFKNRLEKVEDAGQKVNPKKALKDLTKPQKLTLKSKVSLMSSSQLHSQHEHFVELGLGERIIEVKFSQTSKRTLCFMLLNSGFLLMATVKETGFHEVSRVDVKISKSRHEERMQNENRKVYFETHHTEVTEEGEQITPKTGKSVRNGNSPFSGKSKFSNQQSNNQQSQQQTFCTVPETFKQLQQKYYTPSCISGTGHKVVIGYSNCSFIGLLTYSALNHRDYKFRYIFDFFHEKEQIESLSRIQFANDGCHCSVLLRMDPGKVASQNSVNGSTQIQTKFKVRQKNSNANATRKCLPHKQSSLLPQKKRTLIEHSGTSGHHKLSIQQCSLSGRVVDIDTEHEVKEHFAVLQIDFISGTIEHEHHAEATEGSLTSCSLKGVVDQVEFNHMNNTAIFLMAEGALMYCYLNVIHVDGRAMESPPGHCSELNALKDKLNMQKNSFFGTGKVNSISNYLCPDSVLLWKESTKVKPSLILTHPVVFEVLLVTSDSVKFHFYSRSKILDCHHMLSLKNCKAASYSPHGDKLALGTVGAILLIDSYRHQVIKKISLAIFPTSNLLTQSSLASSKFDSLSEKGELTKSCPMNSHDRAIIPNLNPNFRRTESVFATMSSKTVSKIKFLNATDMMLQTGNTTLSMLLNYEKVIYFGITPSIRPELVTYDPKHRLGVMADENNLKVITKCGINSKNKCEELARIELKISCLCLCSGIDILFMGGSNGILYFVRWPDFFQSDHVKSIHSSNKIPLFSAPIVSIEISINYKHLYVTSKDGMVTICDLVQSDEIERIGKDVSFAMSKRIDIELPLKGRWLMSTLEDEKHTHNVTKLMGNEAEVKNNEVLLAQEYQIHKKRMADLEKGILDEDTRREIKEYELSCGVDLLNEQIISAREQLKTTSVSRDIQIKNQLSEFEKSLHSVFQQRQTLELQKSQLLQSIQDAESHLVDTNKTQLQNFIDFSQMEADSHQLRNHEAEKMFARKESRDKAVELNAVEDFMDEKSEIEQHYSQILSQIYHKNNELTTQNRLKKVQIIDITESTSEMAARIIDLENDLTELEKERAMVLQTHSALASQIRESDRKYDCLLKRAKEYEVNLNSIRTISDSGQLRFEDLTSEVEEIQQKWRELQAKKQEAEEGFRHEFLKKESNSTKIKEISQCLKHKKVLRKSKFDYSVVLKNLVRLYSHVSKVSYEERTKDELLMLNQSVEEILSFKIEENDKIKLSVDKWKGVKDENKGKFIKYNEKLEQENNKLIYRYNELKKEHQDFRILQKNLIEEISKQKRSAQQLKQRGAIQKGVFQELRNNSISCHFLERKGQQKSELDRLRSLVNRKQAKPKHLADRLKGLKDPSSSFNTQSENQKGTPLGKKSIGRIQFDSKTLKPKKTLCLSLHSDGSGSKFITQL